MMPRCVRSSGRRKMLRCSPDACNVPPPAIGPLSIWQGTATMKKEVLYYARRFVRPVAFIAHAVPPADIERFISYFGSGDPSGFVAHLADFGEPLAEALARGAKIAIDGTPFGFRETDITLFRPIAQPVVCGAAINVCGREYRAAIPEFPTYKQLLGIMRRMRVFGPGPAIGRLAYWFYTAAQVYAMERRLFVMDHARGEWEPYVYRPLWNARGMFDY